MDKKAPGADAAVQWRPEQAVCGNERQAAGHVPFLIEDPERIPSPRYYDEDFYRLECERLWPHTWQMACRIEQIPSVGDWFEYEILGRSVIVVRTKAGIRAYHNACRHRGAKLAEGHGNCKSQGFICPFHGWRWDLEGRNRFVYGRHMFSDSQLDEADLALPACRVEEWSGCVFINFDDNAPSLRQSLGTVAERMEKYETPRMRAEWWYSTILPANWKVAMEAFMEGYHVLRTHPQLHRAAPAMYNMMYGQDTGGIGVPVNPKATTQDNIRSQIRHFALLSEGMAGMCHAKDVASAAKLSDVDLPDDPIEALPLWFAMVNAQVTRDGRARGEATPDLNALAATDPIKPLEFIFPNYFLLPCFSSQAAYRIRPLGPESCVFDLWSLTLFPEGEEPAPVMEPTVLPHDSKEFPPIPQQDYSNIPRQQKGLRTRGFEFMRLSKDIEGLISNYQRLIDGYLKGAPSDALARANRLLSHNFDGPILDLGLDGARADAIE